jgi:hypothetical protein
MRLANAHVAQEGIQLGGAIDHQRCMLVEILEKAPFLGHQSTEHGGYPRNRCHMTNL